MEDTGNYKALKEKLLAAGIDEIALHGVSGFSLRRVAAACGASCAAPYKHFKNKEEFISAVIAFANEKWEHLGNQISECFADPAQRVASLCVANVKFRIANPLYGANQDTFDRRISDEIYSFFSRNDRSDADSLFFGVMALTLGAAAMIESGKLENCKKSYDMLYEKIKNTLE